jgi:hypothetical protein
MKIRPLLFGFAIALFFPAGALPVKLIVFYAGAVGRR